MQAAIETSSLFKQLITAIGADIMLTEDQVQRICDVLELKTFKKKAFVLKEGDTCRYQHFVLSGCLKVYYTDPDANEHVVKFAPANWWAFDLESFAMQTPAFYAIQAIADTQTLSISHHNHTQLLNEIPAMERYTRLLFQRAYIMLQHRLTQNLYADAEEKFTHMVNKFPGIQQLASQKDQASYLGITPEFLSMLRKRRALSC